MSFDQQEKRFIEMTENILQFFNTGRRKKLMVGYYVADGNRAEILWGDVIITDGLTVHEAYIYVWGFTSGRCRR